ncbi:XTP/dITP diphosphatase [bacterium]|nr:XTP/dITP diphosphatase [bacterium]MBU4560767.1 XTP/dITP diphosphatase [bacterium]MCG2677230.1 XTP/dITP diphosphatase [bacterium]
MQIVLATRNLKKVKEIREILKRLDVEFLFLKDFPEIKEIEEKGKTFSENATLKARKVTHLTKKITLADDSGLEVDALGGRPGIYSARFARNDRERNRKLLRLLKNVPASKRGATFRCAVAIAWPNGKIRVLEGKYQGKIAFKERGKEGFGFDPVFIAPRYDKTFAELGLKKKNRISHRSQAFRKAKKLLKKMLHQDTR